MKLKKRKKSRKMRGTRYHGKAAKKHKGKGNKGGKGLAGTGKRADHKKTKIIKKGENYFGKMGITSRSMRKSKQKKMNICDIEKNLNSMLNSGVGKKSGDKIEISLPKVKVLGNGEITKVFLIKAGSFSKKAKEKIEKAGGQAIAI